MQSVIGDGCIELVANQSRLHAGPSFFDIQFDQPVHVLGKVNDQRMANRLACETGSPSPGQQGDPMCGCVAHDHTNIVIIARQDQPNWQNLIDAGVGGIDAEGVGVKGNIAPYVALKGVLQSLMIGSGHGSRVPLKDLIQGGQQAFDMGFRCAFAHEAHAPDLTGEGAESATHFNVVILQQAAACSGIVDAGR